jgi:hypothetical protein
MFFSSKGSATGTNATILSPKMNFSETSKVTFYFRMPLSNSDTTALEVYKWSSESNKQILFNTTGDQSGEWQQASVCLPIGIYRLAFVGIVGNPSLSDIALDNISISNRESSCAYLSQPTGYGEFRITPSRHHSVLL